MREILKDLFQLCLDSGKIPSDWMKAIIKPIPKSRENDPRIPLNYRGISLLCCSLKMFTNLINIRVLNVLNKCDELCDEQNGFRSDRSCTDHIFVLHSIVSQRLNLKLSTFATYIDFSKAFDGISREMLLHKMLTYGIDGKLYFLLKYMYSQTEACVKVNNHHTDWFQTKTGVMQGDSFSPTAFNIFINDLAMSLKELNIGVKINNMCIPILMYADDVVILANDEVELQTLLTHVNRWCKKWLMTVNLKKSKVMHFRPKNVNQCINDMYLGDDKLDYIDTYKYLGVYFNEHLDFQFHCNTLKDAGTRALGAVIGKFRELNDLPYESFYKCFDSNVNPVTDYGAEVWGYMKDSSTDLVQLNATKTFLGVHKFAPNPGVLGDMGWTPSCIRRKICLLRYWNRLINMNNSRLTKCIFNEDYKSNGTWCDSVKTIFKECNRYDIYVNRIPCDLADIKQKLLSLYIAELKTKIEQMPKLRTYRQIKENFETEYYVKINKDLYWPSCDWEYYL